MLSRPCRACAAIVVGIWMTCSGCDDVQERVMRTPIVVFALEYPEPVITSANDSVLVRAAVGYGDCRLEDASIELRGDSLVVTGVAHCRYVEPRNAILTPHKVLTPPAEPNLQSFRLPFPTVVPGTYVLVAGDLGDTLTVAPATLPPQSLRIAASGHTFAVDSCAVFETLSFALEYELAGVAPPQFGRSVRLYATFAGDPVCNPSRFVARLDPRCIESAP